MTSSGRVPVSSTSTVLEVGVPTKLCERATSRSCLAIMGNHRGPDYPAKLFRGSLDPLLFPPYPVEIKQG